MARALSGVGTGIRAGSSQVARRPRLRWDVLEMLPTVGLGLLVLLAALLYVWQHTYVVHLGYEIERLREYQAGLVQENKELKLEIGQLRSLKRVEEIARTRLGMVTPKPGQVILVPQPAVQ
jgi:cell division protein FtsL